MVHTSGHARGWGAHVAIGIAATLLLAGQAYGKQGDAEITAHKTQAPSQAVAFDNPKPYKSPTRCEHPESAEQENLCIERRSAKATEDQAYWARLTFWIGVAGTSGVVLTLFATAWAAWAAQRSARAAERSIEKSDALLTHAQQTSERQLRAYVCVEDSHVTGIAVGSRPTIQVRFRNVGETPALNLNCYGNLAFARFPLIEPLHPFDVSIERSVEPLGPTMGRSLTQRTFPEVLTVDQVEGINRGEWAIYAYGEIKYDDVFGRQHTTKFCRFAGGVVPVNEVATYHTGNEMD